MKKIVLLVTLLMSFKVFSQRGCEKAIHYEYSSFNSEHRFFTPTTDEKGKEERIFFEKAVSKGETQYYAHLKVHHSTFYTALTDFTIFFADGSKIVRRQQMIDVKPSKITDFYKSATLFRITENEFKLFLGKRILSFRIQTDDFKVPEEESIQLKQDAECLKNAQIPK
ncbi:hypothetical protein [Runella sp.]|uniref:hypothetical protein n=1 Tax=Runella sp. TaxID=1960881 RepID=UPI003D0B3F23